MNILGGKKGILIIVIATVLIIVAILFFGILPNMNKKEPVPEDQGPISETRKPVPDDAAVLEVGDTTSNEEVAVPVSVAPAAPGVEAKLRTFNISADRGVFTPSEVTVNKGDTVHINFSAKDKEYDMVLPDYGMKQIANLGETKIFEFQATDTGKFAYYCELCGGLASPAVGYIIVK
ncbi:MAG: cupredoxin domain-containing protein [Candidatus Colwellbacteria bacterium]|nr:cupredoxin domain-containing protein [Candidatus Colwellbacteria bacterium]